MIFIASVIWCLICFSSYSWGHCQGNSQALKKKRKKPQLFGHATNKLLVSGLSYLLLYTVFCLGGLMVGLYLACIIVGEGLGKKLPVGAALGTWSVGGTKAWNHQLNHFVQWGTSAGMRSH